MADDEPRVGFQTLWLFDSPEYASRGVQEQLRYQSKKARPRLGSSLLFVPPAAVCLLPAALILSQHPYTEHQGYDWRKDSVVEVSGGSNSAGKERVRHEPRLRTFG